MGDDEPVGDKVKRWTSALSDGCFPGKRIEDEAVGAMLGVASAFGVARVRAILQVLEDKAGQIRNPSNYLKAAARREGLGPQDED